MSHIALTCIIAFIIVLMISCSRPSQVETATTPLADTTPVVELPAPKEPTEPESPPAEAAAFASEIKKQREALQNTAYVYEVTVSTMQYEASSDIIWQFDKSFSPLYFKDNWAMEGTEGTTEYFIVDDNVHCVIDEDSYGTGTSSTKWCSSTGGIKTTYDDDQGQEQTDVLPDNYVREVTAAYAGKLTTLNQILKTASIKSDDGEIYQLKIETKPYEGDDFIESTTISIPKALYEEIIK